jgi:hypothetical protein
MNCNDSFGMRRGYRRLYECNDGHFSLIPSGGPFVVLEAQGLWPDIIIKPILARTVVKGQRTCSRAWTLSTVSLLVSAMLRIRSVGIQAPNHIATDWMDCSLQSRQISPDRSHSGTSDRCDQLRRSVRNLKLAASSDVVGTSSHKSSGRRACTASPSVASEREQSGRPYANNATNISKVKTIA